MSEKTISFEISSDSDGYVGFECPFCQVGFKLLANEVQNNEEFHHELFCPYCGLTDKSNNFYIREVSEHIHALAENYMNELINKSLYIVKSNRTLRVSKRMHSIQCV